MPDWQVVYCETAEAVRPVEEYILGVGSQEAARILRDLELLKTAGLTAVCPLVSHIVGTRLWELRSRGKQHHRVFYIAASGRRFVLFHAFTKTTPKTPPGEIRVALNRLADFEEREIGGKR